MNTADRILWSQHLGQKNLGYQCRLRQWQRGVKCVFIINFLFFLFLGFHSGVGVGGNFQFLNEYGELESVDPEYWVESFGVSDPSDSGSGGVLIVTLS